METTPQLTQSSKIINGVKQIIAVAAGKGGVGKSSITACLALALQQLGFKVGVLDADVYGPSIRKMLPEEALPSKGMVSENSIIPAKSFGMPCMSMGFFSSDNEPSIIRAPKANAIILQFLRDVEWGDLDYLLIDFPPGTGDIQLTIMQEIHINAALLITTPQDVATSDVSKAFRMFEAMNVPVLGIIENMSYFKIHDTLFYPLGQAGGKRLAERLGLPLLAEIPLDPMVSEYMDKGLSLFAANKPSLARTVFEMLAVSLPETMQALEECEAKSLKNFEIVWKDLT